MNKKLRWYEYLSLNSYSLGLNLSTATITPILLPYLVVMFMPPEEKNKMVGGNAVELYSLS